MRNKDDKKYQRSRVFLCINSNPIYSCSIKFTFLPEKLFYLLCDLVKQIKILYNSNL